MKKHRPIAAYVHSAIASESAVSDQVIACLASVNPAAARRTILYVDNGIGGAERPGGPAFRALMKDAEAGRFGILLVRDLARLAREQSLLLRRLEQLSDLGVHVVVREPPQIIKAAPGRRRSTIKGLLPWADLRHLPEAQLDQYVRDGKCRD